MDKDCRCDKNISKLNKDTTTLEFTREKALKLIPDDFNEKDLEKLLEIVQRLGNLTPEEREEIFKGIGTMEAQELIARLEKGNQHKKEEK